MYIQKKNEKGEHVFKYVRGSDYPPNLHYNASRKVIESTMFHGAVSFVDYKIIGDTLIEVGGLDVDVDVDWIIRTNYIINKKGERIEMKADSTFGDFENMYSREYKR